jgi:hypothetical protein
MKMITAPCLVVALVALAGCGGETGPKTMRVWGDVSYDDKPVEDGTITFETGDGSAPAQGQIKAGHYDVPAAAGPMPDKTYVVKINALAKTGKTVPNVMGDGAPTMDVMMETIPIEYNAKSNLKATISPDSSKNQFDFKLARGVVPKP